MNSFLFHLTTAVLIPNWRWCTDHGYTRTNPSCWRRWRTPFWDHSHLRLILLFTPMMTSTMEYILFRSYYYNKKLFQILITTNSRVSIWGESMCSGIKTVVKAETSSIFLKIKIGLSVDHLRPRPILTSADQPIYFDSFFHACANW